MGTEFWDLGLFYQTLCLLKSLPVDLHFPTWLLTGWHSYCQLFGSNARKLLIANSKIRWNGISTVGTDCIERFAIQIKICAEYRDMLPRPRLVCQEPGLRPIGRSPGVPDKSSRGLGSMSRYSAQILICFIAYIFLIFNFSVGLVGNLAELPPCTVPPATVHCYQNEAAQCSSDNQISQHALLRGSRKKHSLAFMPQNWWN